jgi:hypothetical protein
MDKATLALHRQLIRLVKGMVSAWEEWVNAKAGGG